MTEDPQPAPEKSEVEKLRDEFAEQFSTMKTAFESQIAELSKSNEELRNHNSELQRALIRNATSEPAPAPREPTPEEQHQAVVADRVKRAQELQRFM